MKRALSALFVAAALLAHTVVATGVHERTGDATGAAEGCETSSCGCCSSPAVGTSERDGHSTACACVAATGKCACAPAMPNPVPPPQSPAPLSSPLRELVALAAAAQSLSTAARIETPRLASLSHALPHSLDHFVQLLFCVRQV